jgi:hypothetical protein
MRESEPKKENEKKKPFLLGDAANSAISPWRGDDIRSQQAAEDTSSRHTPMGTYEYGSIGSGGWCLGVTVIAERRRGEEKRSFLSAFYPNLIFPFIDILGLR